MSVTTASTGVTRRPARQGVLIASLVVSIALNVCFVAGAAWSRYHTPAGPLDQAGHYRKLSSALDLTPPQRTAFDKYVAEMSQRTQSVHKQIAPLIGAAWEEIAKPNADSKQIMQLFNQAAENRRDYQREITVETLTFLSQLTPDQRSKFVAVARERRAAWLRSPQPH